MILYPAIDLLGGNAVRLRQGKRDDVTVYGEPCAIAEKYAATGAKWLHLVDLGAAFDGQGKDPDLIRRIVRSFGGQVELGGGLRNMQAIENAIDSGITRCIIGTAAIEHPELVEEACMRFPGQIAVGIDAKNGMVATRGWESVSQVTAVELALKMKEYGVDTVIYTDVSRDGMMQGPNVQQTQHLVEATGLRVTGSGGVSSMQDLYNLRDAGCAGAILGKALYEGAFTLEEALAAFE